ncbi:uncharacterized protein EV420DRAFT_1480426 [Desarmillaria tabescens]|uniref:DUF6533 domain-containing protein n=1 Tax=Armillaria tabescens TaxID=1929756 RepID=A0AA39N5B1_ARMTA|nr:uncharacterized protein EV420DRAFT_1480426 [Desarmillaria tabescens]KAK0457820.1 hypothetical protein EV420DRAFT_1480426 [Desarmillaria tabescens]
MASTYAESVTTHFLQFRIQYSSIALLYYDYFLTFPMEVKYIWGAKFRLSTILCDTWYKIIAALSVIGRAAVIVTFTVRTYAIFARNTIILLYLTAIGLANDRCKSRTSDVSDQQMILSLMRLFQWYSFSLADAEDYTKRFTSESLLLSILLVVSSDTPFRAFETQTEGDSVVTLFTTAALVLNSAAPVDHAGFFRRLLNALTLPLSGLLTARFLLRLRAWEHKQSALVTGTDRRTASNPIPPIEFRVLSVIDEFGEDPVSMAECRQSESGYVLEEVRRGTSTGNTESGE